MFKFKKKENKVSTNTRIIITSNDIDRILKKFTELEKYDWNGSPIEVTFGHGYSSMIFNGYPIYTHDWLLLTYMEVPRENN